MALFRLTAKLGLDGSTFEKGLAKAKSQTSQFAKGVREQGRAISQNLVGGVAGAVGGIFAASAIKGYTDKIRSLSAEYVNTADAIGVSIRKLQEWEFTASQTNTELGTFVDAAKTLAKNLDDFQMGTGEAKIGLEKMGFEAKDFKGVRLEDAFDMIAKRAGELGDEALPSVQRAMGESATRLMPAFKAGLKGIADQAERLKLIMDELDVRKIAAADDELDRQLRRLRRPAARALGAALDFAGESAGDIGLFGPAAGRAMLRSTIPIIGPALASSRLSGEVAGVQAQLLLDALRTIARNTDPDGK